MAHIQPFKAIRPMQDKVALVASRSYETYRREELTSVLQHNPFSFLHILSPGFTSGNRWGDAEPLRLVQNRYQEFLARNILQRDQEACFYAYQIKHPHFSTFGFFCACSVEDYEKGVIKKHENTVEQRETLLADYFYTAGFNAEPVLLTYPDEVFSGALLQKEALRPPEYDFKTADGVRHTLWKISDIKTITRLQSVFEPVQALYIADGHHRCIASQLLAQKRKAENPAHTGEEAYNFFMAYLIPESQLTIYGFNRMVKDLNGLSVTAFLKKLTEHFKIEKKEEGLFQPVQKHHFSMYLEGTSYLLHLRKNPYRFTHALSALDPEILYKTILEPVLGVSDLKHDKRMGYKSSHHPLARMKDAIDKGDFAVGFSFAPLTIKDIKAVADAGLLMPPKSTYIEPKLHSGLTLYEL